MPHVNHVSELVLDEWTARELDPQQSVRVADHVAACEQCRARHEALERERAAFLTAAPSFEVHAARFVSESRDGPADDLRSGRAPVSRPRWPRSARQPLLLAASSFAAMAAAALLVVWLGPSDGPTRSKGQPHVGWFVKRGDRVHRGNAGEPLYPHDALRFVYTSDAARYFALFNADAQTVTVYYPPGPNAARVPPGADVALEFSVELDDQLGTERVYAMFCESGFEVEPLRAVLVADGRMPDRAGCVVDVVTLRKVAR